MNKILVVLACLAVLAGGAYVLSGPPAPDPATVAAAEALAVHTRAIRSAIAEKCVDARGRLAEWRQLKKAGTPSPDDTKQARKVLRQLLKDGCRDHALTGAPLTRTT